MLNVVFDKTFFNNVSVTKGLNTCTVLNAHFLIKQYLSFELDDQNDGDETESVGSDCIGTDDEDANEDDEVVNSDEQKYFKRY